MKGIRFRTVVLVFCVLAVGESRAHALDMKEGEWEIVSETSITMGGMSMPGMTDKSTHCLTREDPVPTAEKEKDCKVVDQKVVGNTVSWRIVCKEGEGEGEITYAASGKSYAGTIRMKTAAGAEAPKKRTEKSAVKSKRKPAAEEGAEEEAATVTIKLSGKYLGPCPVGQKSGPTGETAKKQAQVEQTVAQAKQTAAQAKQQQAQMQAEQEAIAKNTEAFMKRAVVPAEERGACAQKGCSRTPECGRTIGEVNLKPGDYEITIEQASRIGTHYTPVKTEKKTVYLDGVNPVPDALSCGQSASVKWGKERITWTDTPGGGAPSGGIPRILSKIIPSAHAMTEPTMGGASFHGNSFDGATRSTTALGGGQQSVSVTRTSGRWVGEGKPPRGMGHYPPPPKGSPSNPIPKVKGLFDKLLK